MGNTIYASFADPSMAEKAAGALLDHGVKNEDLSIVSSHSGEGYEKTNVAHTTGDSENDAKNAADGAWGKTEAAGNTAASWGNSAAGAVADGLGQEGTAANYRSAAERNEREASADNADANREIRDSVDADGSGSSRYTTTNTNDSGNDGDGVESSAKHGISTTTGADAGAGAVKGAGWGLGIGALAALASLFIPGVGIVVGGGALAAALGGAAAATAAGAAAGAVTGYLKDQGVDADIAEQYESTVRSGGAILAVSVPSGDCGVDEAMEVITKYGGAQVNSYATSSSGYMA